LLLLGVMLLLLKLLLRLLLPLAVAAVPGSGGLFKWPSRSMRALMPYLPPRSKKIEGVHTHKFQIEIPNNLGSTLSSMGQLWDTMKVATVPFKRGAHAMQGLLHREPPRTLFIYRSDK
jgi:hypothetical protein